MHVYVESAHKVLRIGTEVKKSISYYHYTENWTDPQISRGPHIAI
jgi:hypothetical protein